MTSSVFLYLLMYKDSPWRAMGGQGVGGYEAEVYTI